MGKKDDRQRIIMISLDATGKRDMEFMLKQPNFKKIVSEGAFCDNVYSVYPSITYPAHTSIVTGLTPNHHRIVNNTLFQPSRKHPDWMYKEKYIQGKTLVDIAREKKMVTMSLLWPVMGGAKIKLNLPEILVTRKLQTQATVCLANGTPKFLLEINSKFGHLRNGIKQPELDNFVCASAKYAIEKYDPDFMLIHFTDVDTNRHLHGVDAPEITEGLKRHDQRLGELIETLKKVRSMDKTTIIVLGDHCQLDMHTIVYLNKIFLDKGFLTVKDGKITDYKVIAKENDGSTYVYLNEKYASDNAFLDELTDTLNEIKNDECLGVEEIYTSKESAKMGADGNCFCMIEGKPGYYFLNEFDVLTEKVSETKNNQMFATHGCLPTKEGNITFFAACGYGIKKGARVGSMHLWDEGPTIAKLMGGSLPNTDGHVIEEFLTQSEKSPCL